MELPKHGSPADRGSADAYYGRDYDPHHWPLGTYVGDRVEMKDMTPDEIVLYSTAYRDAVFSRRAQYMQDYRKVW